MKSVSLLITARTSSSAIAIFHGHVHMPAVRSCLRSYSLFFSSVRSCCHCTLVPAQTAFELLSRAKCMQISLEARVV